MGWSKGATLGVVGCGNRAGRSSLLELWEEEEEEEEDLGPASLFAN